MMQYKIHFTFNHFHKNVTMSKTVDTEYHLYTGAGVGKLTAKLRRKYCNDSLEITSMERIR